MAVLSNMASRLYNETQAPKRAIITFHNIKLQDIGDKLIKKREGKKTKIPLLPVKNTNLSDSGVFDIIKNNYDYVDRFKVDRNEYQYRVMFNPSSIKLSASGGGLVQKVKYNVNDQHNDHTEATSEVSYITNTRRNMMFNVNLIFDQVNPSDAFTQVNPFELSGSVKSAVNAVNNNVLNKDYSVQKDVEGFLSSCRRPSTRWITFQMGDLSYTGVLFQVSAQYTMFNPNGEPIRAVVYLQMTIIDTNLHYGDMGQFTESFKEVFGQGQNVSLNSAKNKVSGLFNLDL